MKRLNPYFRFAAACALLLSLAALAQAQTWTQDGPLPRYNTSAVYDSATDQLIVFGGQQGGTLPNLNDVWADIALVASGQDTQASNNWVQRFPVGTAPSARFGSSAIYDSGSNRVLIFGGSTGTACQKDTYLLDGANGSLGTLTWLTLSTFGSKPASRQGHAAVYDPVTNTMILFGGNNCSTGYFADVWTLSHANGQGGNSTWTKLAPIGPGPAAREYASAVYDSANNVMIVYGGDTGTTGYADVWTLSNANGTGGTPRWKKLAPTGVAPAARTGQSAVYDSANNRLILYGGADSAASTTPFGDSWVLTFANGLGGTPAWTQLAVTGTAPTRRNHFACYNAAFNDLVIFGGLSQITGAAASDQIFILSKANGL